MYDDSVFQYHIGTEVHVIDILHGWRSLAPLWYQVKKFHEEMAPVMQKASDGVILIGNTYHYTQFVHLIIQLLHEKRNVFL